MTAYPTFLFLNENGELIHRLVGYMEASDFIESTRLGFEGDNITTMQKQYQLGDVDDAFLLKYFQRLNSRSLSIT